jgi:hypothetical protein
MPLIAVNVTIHGETGVEAEHTFNTNASAAHFITEHQLVPEERERRLIHTEPFSIGVTYDSPLHEQEYVDTIICRTWASFERHITQHELDSRWRRLVAIDNMEPYPPEYPYYPGGMRGGASFPGVAGHQHEIRADISDYNGRMETVTPGIASMGAEIASYEDASRDIWRANWHPADQSPNTARAEQQDLDRFNMGCLESYLGIGYSEREEKRRQEINESLQRAESRLNGCLTTQEAVELSQLGTITIDTPLGLFRIGVAGKGFSAPSFNVLHKGRNCCLVIKERGMMLELPHYDHIAMQVLLIKTNPTKFLQEANQQGDRDGFRRAFYMQRQP